MSIIELSRSDPPSPPRPPPPSPDNAKFRGPRLIELSRQDPPSPPSAPPPSPTKNCTLGFPKLFELSRSLRDLMQEPKNEPERPTFFTDYTDFDDDMSLPGSPPPLEYSPPGTPIAMKRPGSNKRRRCSFDDNHVDNFGSALLHNKRQRTVINIDDGLFIMPAADLAFGDSFFDTIFPAIPTRDSESLQEYVHANRNCSM